MRVVGAILPAGDGIGVNKEAWCQLVERSPEFCRPEPRHTINPFTREPMMTPTNRDVATVVIDGITLGNVSWSMDEDEPLVNVTIERSAIPLVLQWAAELGGEFRENTSLADA